MGSEREIVSLHVGQAGVQMGNAFWELLCLEHGINPAGKRTCPATDACQTFFHRAPAGNYLPRAIHVDLEPSVINKVKSGTYQNLFNSGWMVSGKEDAANNFGRGYYSEGSKEAAVIVLEKLRGVLELTHLPQGIFVFNSMGGGTGSGLTTNLVHTIHERYPKLSVIDFAVFPSPIISSAVVEPYNSVLAVHGTMDTVNCMFSLDNEALFGICEKKLGITKPTFANLNRIIGQAASGISAPIRFQGSTNPVDLDELQTNLIPYPRMHFPVVSTAPLEPTSRPLVADLTAELLLSSCFKPENHLIKIQTENSRYMACCLLMRGDVTPEQINIAVADIRSGKTIDFAESSPTGFKVGFCGSPPVAAPQSGMLAGPRGATLMSNTSAVAPFWKDLNKRFSSMFRRRAYLHHYIGEGMEEAEFLEAKEDLQALEMDYTNIG